MPVSFCVVGSSPRFAEIVMAAEAAASLNPIGRRVLVPSDEGYPSNMAQLIAGVPDPGAAVLRANGVLFAVLTTTQAVHEAVDDFVMAEAALGTGGSL